MCARARVCVCGGGGVERVGGGSRSNGQKTSDLVVTCVFFCCFLSPQIILKRGSNSLFQGKIITAS